MAGHAGVDDDAPSLVLAIDPELGGGNGGIKDSEDIGAINIVKVILGQFGGGLDDRNTSVLQASTKWGTTKQEKGPDVLHEIQPRNVEAT